MGRKRHIADKTPFLEKGHLLLPMRDQAGRLVIQKEKARFDDSLHKGPLPYTEENLLILARRHLGAPYGWGGRKESVDCSALTQDVYRSMGIELPRNSGEQARTTPGVSFQGLSRKARLSLLKTLPVGSLLYMPGHIMIYSGEKNGIPMVIHALGSKGVREKGAVRKVPVMKVVETPVEILGSSGVTLLAGVTKGIVME